MGFSCFEGLVDQNIVLEVIDVGHYMILPADYLAPDLIRCIATECGVDIDEYPEAMIIDHINYDSTLVEGDHTLIAGDDLIQSGVILGSKKIDLCGREHAS
uniref:Uncharacterized protein n=3 Tax=Aegilops tauschii subsp. strangulata TaxID=200361 RepID=A0A452Y9D2_AEGTS